MLQWNEVCYQKFLLILRHKKLVPLKSVTTKIIHKISYLSVETLNHQHLKSHILNNSTFKINVYALDNYILFASLCDQQKIIR